MASETEAAVFEAFRAVSTGLDGSVVSGLYAEDSIASTLAEVFDKATEAITRPPAPPAPASQDGSIDVSPESSSRLNTVPVTESIGGSPSQPGGGGSSIASTLISVFAGGLGIVPLVTGLLGLFGGGSAAPSPLEKYVMPDRLSFWGADTVGGIENSDYDQYGSPRLFSDLTRYSSPQSTQSNSGSESSGAANRVTPQINVTVNAIDSQSFLDHSTEIAQAVRQAMLNLNSVTDIVNDL
jgi:hypothetical protein